MQEKYDHLFKFVVLGNTGVGKSSLILRYTDDAFTSNFISTLGVDFKIRNIQASNETIKLQIWDTAGQERFRTIYNDRDIRAANGILLCFDTTDRQSFEEATKTWLPYILRSGFTSPIVLIGTKSDLIDQRVVSEEEAKEFAAATGMTYIETSSKMAHNVDRAFQTLAEKSLAKALGQEKGAEKELEKEKEKEKKPGKFKRMLGRSEKKKGDEKDKPRKPGRKERKLEETAKKELQELKNRYGAAFTALDDGTSIANERILERVLAEGTQVIERFEEKGIHPHLQAEFYFQLGRTAAALKNIPQAFSFYSSAFKLGDKTMQADAKARIERLNPTAPAKAPVHNVTPNWQPTSPNNKGGLPHHRTQRGFSAPVKPQPAPKKPDGKEKEPEKENEKERLPHDEGDLSISQIERLFAQMEAEARKKHIPQGEEVEPEILEQIREMEEKEADPIQSLRNAYEHALTHFGAFTISDDGALKAVVNQAEKLINESKGQPQLQAKADLVKGHANLALGTTQLFTVYDKAISHGDEATKNEAEQSLSKHSELYRYKRINKDNRFYFSSTTPTIGSVDEDAKDAIDFLKKAYNDATPKGGKADKQALTTLSPQMNELAWNQFPRANVSEYLRAELHFLAAKTHQNLGIPAGPHLHFAKELANPDLQKEIATWGAEVRALPRKSEPEKRKKQPKAPTPRAVAPKPAPHSLSLAQRMERKKELDQNLSSQEAALQTILDDSGYGNKSQSMVTSDLMGQAPYIHIDFETTAEAQALYMALRDNVGDQFISYLAGAYGIKGIFRFQYQNSETKLLPRHMIAQNYNEIVESFKGYKASLEKGEIPQMHYLELKAQDHPRHDEPEKRKEQPKHQQPKAPTPRAVAPKPAPVISKPAPKGHSEQLKELQKSYDIAAAKGQAGAAELENSSKQQEVLAKKFLDTGAPAPIVAQLRFLQARTTNRLYGPNAVNAVNDFLVDAERNDPRLKDQIAEWRKVYKIPAPSEKIEDTSITTTQIRPAAIRGGEKEEKVKELEVYEDFEEYLKATIGKDKADALICSLSFEPFKDPVFTADGHVYERANITEWLKGHNTSPKTGAELENKILTPNHSLKALIKDYHRDFEKQLPNQGRSL